MVLRFTAIFVLSLSWISAILGAEPARPNIVFILADDLGYGELGCFGQTKIKTPHLDRLAAEGMRLTQHYAGNAVCAPSRCVLMTGKHPGHAFIRDNRSTPPGEGQYPIPADTITLPKLLNKAGYVCGGFGKWGLGGPGSEGEPLKQGLNRFFGFNCQGVAHNHYPTYLWDNDQQVRLNNPEFSAHQALAKNLDPRDPASYTQFQGKEFAQDRIMEQALKFVRDNRERPFFLYVPSTIPHVAIQVPDDSLREYLGQFEETPYIGNKGYLPHFTPRAAFAAMITRLDRDVGRIVALVRELGLEDNTLFVFSSDNGPLDHAYQGFAGTDGRFFNSAGPLRGQKGSLYEGGFRVPTIARWKGKIPAGTTSERVSGFEDWLPTLLDVAGAKDSIPKEIDGISLWPTLQGKAQPERPFLYREFPSYGGQQIVRIGDWKGVRQNLKPTGKNKDIQPSMKIELYNLKDDIAETKDVSAEHPEIIAKMEKLMREQHTPSAEFPLPALDRLVAR